MLRPFRDDPDPRVVASMIRALEDVLQVPAHHCQMSALHGLGHLSHPKKETIIRDFLASRNLDDEIVQYAEKAIAGTVL